MRPTLRNSCAYAATAAEAAYRIDVPVTLRRAARVIALDHGAAQVMTDLFQPEWGGTRSFDWDPAAQVLEEPGHLDDLVLRTVDGATTRLSAVLADADIAVMVATTGAGASAAAVIGGACGLRGIMTVGLAIAEGADSDAAVLGLRPHARVLVVSADASDIPELLHALRA